MPLTRASHTPGLRPRVAHGDGRTRALRLTVTMAQQWCEPATRKGGRVPLGLFAPQNCFLRTMAKAATALRAQGHPALIHIQVTFVPRLSSLSGCIYATTGGTEHRMRATMRSAALTCRTIASPRLLLVLAVHRQARKPLASSPRDHSAFSRLVSTKLNVRDRGGSPLRASNPISASHRQRTSDLREKPGGARAVPPADHTSSRARSAARRICVPGGPPPERC